MAWNWQADYVICRKTSYHYTTQILRHYLLPLKFYSYLITHSKSRRVKNLFQLKYGAASQFEISCQTSKETCRMLPIAEKCLWSWMYVTREGFRMAQTFQEWSWRSGRWPKARTTFHIKICRQHWKSYHPGMQRLTIDCQDACVWVGNEQGDSQNHLDWQPWDAESVHENGTKTAERWPQGASSECLQKHLRDDWWRAWISWPGHYWRWNMSFSIRSRDEEAKSPMEVSRITKTKEGQNVQIQDQSDAHHFFTKKDWSITSLCRKGKQWINTSTKKSLDVFTTGCDAAGAICGRTIHGCSIATMHLHTLLSVWGSSWPANRSPTSSTYPICQI